MKKLTQSRSGKIILGLVAALVVVRAAAPTIIEKVVNDALDRAPGIAGRIQDVDLHLYRGAYEIEGIELATIKNGETYPFLKMKEVDISIFWKQLFKGKLVSELYFIEPEFTFYDIKEKEENKYAPIAEEKTWLGLRRDLVPLDIDRLEIVNGQLNFKGRSVEAEKQGRFYITKLNAVTTGLTAEAHENDIAPGKFEGSTLVFGASKARLKGSFDPFSEKPVFDLNASVDRIPAKHMDTLIQVYAPFDIEAGAFDAATEMRAYQGSLDGYVKIGAEDIDVFSWRQDVEVDNDNPLQLFVDAIIGGLSGLLTNPKSDMVAARVPLKGSFDDPDISFFRVMGSILKNAFVQAIDVQIDNILSFGTMANNSAQEQSSQKPSNNNQQASRHEP